MSRSTFNNTWSKQKDRLVAATFKRGIIQNVYPQSATADVQILGTSSGILKSVPLAAHIIPLLVKQGDKCRIDMFDETNANDSVVAYIYGRTIWPPTNGGLFTSPATTNFQIPHGLGVIPTSFYAGLRGPLIVGGTRVIVFINTVDDTYINCQNTVSSTSVDMIWWATGPV